MLGQAIVQVCNFQGWSKFNLKSLLLMKLLFQSPVLGRMASLPPAASEQANCPVSKDLLMNKTVTLGSDADFLKDGYGILLHLLVFGVLAVVGLAAYLARLRWGWEEREAAAPGLAGRK